MSNKRWCYYVDETMNRDGKGFIPAIVVEGEPGYRPQGDPKADGVTAPLAYRWGKTFTEALAICNNVNACRGISESDMFDIVGSSMYGGKK